MEYAAKLLISLWVCLFLSASAVGAESQPPPEGGLLPDIVLTTPKSPELQNYLGISGKQTFKIPEIKAEVVIIEIFNMY
jgi:hypothetical protein